MGKKNIIINIIMLYGLTIAKMVFPLITLPYLTRVLSVDAYGTVAYIKTVMQYMQIIIDFGFILSGTKDIVEAKDSREKINFVIGDILAARIMLVVISLGIVLVLIFILPILRNNAIYTLLSFVSIALTIFLFDYVFRGIEKMHVITIRFVLMKSIATALTFVFVKSDADIIIIPILDIAGTLVAIILVLIELKKNEFCIRTSNRKNIASKLKKSFTYFASDMSTTAFGALNTVLIGIFLPSSDVAFWSICMQLIGAVQSLYNPITSGIYPEMIKTKDLSIVRGCLKLFMPIILAGCVFTFFVAKYALIIVGGYQYAGAYVLLRALIPLLIISFPVMLIGWPTLGAISKEKEVTATTIIAAITQICGLILLIILNEFTLLMIALIRCITEMVLFTGRFILCMKYKEEFN